MGEEDLLQIYKSHSCPLVDSFFSFFFLVFAFFQLVNSPCEQRQGLAGPPSRRTMVKQEKRLIAMTATHKPKKNPKTNLKKKNKKNNSCQHCRTVLHYQTTRSNPHKYAAAAGTTHEQSKMLCINLNIGGRKEGVRVRSLTV